MAYLLRCTRESYYQFCIQSKPPVTACHRQWLILLGGISAKCIILVKVYIQFEVLVLLLVGIYWMHADLVIGFTSALNTRRPSHPNYANCTSTLPRTQRCEMQSCDLIITVATLSFQSLHHPLRCINEMV